jgi:hypothetical protein
MLRICDWTTLRLRVRSWSFAKPLAVAVAGTVLLFAPSARAATIDFNVANGNYDSSLDVFPDDATVNWIDTTFAPAGPGGVPPAVLPTNAPVSVPATTDDAYVRNNGTVIISQNQTALSFRIGASRSMLDPGDPTNTATIEVGLPGTLNWTGGNITGGASGPVLRVGERDNTTNTNFTGTVNQSGGKISLIASGSALTIGANGTTPTPTSVYNLMPGGTIGVVVASNGNNGINVRNGTFNMTGGSIVDDTAAATFGQRAMTISSASGTATDGTAQNVATANISGGTWDTRGGIRMAASSSSSGYLNISGTANIWIRDDLNMCNNATSCYAELNMSGGSLKIGDTTLAQEKNLIVGDRATGVMNLSGGTVSVNNQLRIGNDVAGTGTVTITGGSMTVRTLDLRVNAPTLGTFPDAKLIIDGANASFTQAHTASVGSTSIGSTGIGLFEIRQGTAVLGGLGPLATGGAVELAKNLTSRATLNVKGGKLTIQGTLAKTTVAAPDPVINLTGGTLELNPAAASTSVTWQTNFNNQGTDVILRTGQMLLVNLGDATHNGNFSMSSGSLNLDLVTNTLAGADRFAAQFAGATGSLTGGTLNLNYLSGYTPTPGIELFIVRTPLTGGVTLNAPAVTINAPGGDPNWYLKTVTTGTNHEIRLAYVPEPSSCILVAVGLMAGLCGSRRRS